MDDSLKNNHWIQIKIHQKNKIKSLNRGENLHLTIRKGKKLYEGGINKSLTNFKNL